MNNRIVFLWIFSQIFLIASCSPAVFLSTSQRLEQEGDELALADRASEAILAYHQAAAADPNNRSTLMKLIPLYHGQGRTREAARYINRLTADEKSRFGSDLQVVKPENLDLLKLHWIITPAEDIPTGIAVDAEIVGVAYHNGLVSGLHLKDGTILWSQKLPEAITSPPVISRNSIIVGCESGKLIALNRMSGEVLWQVQLPGAVYAGLLVDGSRGYIGSYGGIMTSINLTDGKILWQIDAGNPIVASAMKEANTIYFGTPGGSVYSVGAENGKQLWEKPVQLPGGIESTPVLAENRLLIGNNDSRLYALDLNGKDYYWAHSTLDSIYASTLVDGNQVYVFSIGQTAAAVNLFTGKPAWEQELPVAVRNTPVMDNRALYFSGTTQPYLFKMNADTGEIIGQANTGDWIEYGPVKASGFLLLAGKDGAIIAYQIVLN